MELLSSCFLSLDSWLFTRGAYDQLGFLAAWQDGYVLLHLDPGRATLACCYNVEDPPGKPRH